MKISIEKRLHETAQELEKLAWLSSNSATCPSLIELDSALRHSAWLMRLARAGLAYRAGKIKELEEEISIWRSFMVPEPVRKKAGPESGL